MKRNRGANDRDPVYDEEKAREMASDWVIEKAGELGISDDVITKRYMLDGYLGETDRFEEVHRD